MKILLVNPWSLKKFNVIVIPNLALGYLASSLQKEGHEVEIIDCVRDKIDVDKFGKYIRVKNFDMIGFSLFTPYIGAVRRYSAVVKEADSNITTIVGGPHAVLEPVETLEILKDIDFAFLGEAEKGFCQLAVLMGDANRKNIFEDFHHVDNLVWRNFDKTIICNPRVYITDLDELPFPAWGLLQLDKYPLAPIGIFSKRNKVVPIITTRGCPCPCTFCAAGKMAGKRIRTRSVKNIIEEIRFLVDKYGVEEINIIDDNFTQKYQFVKDFCCALLEHKFNISWSCPNGIRLDTLDAALLQLMEKAGCYSFGVGIEFGTQKMLDQVRKNITLEAIEEKISLIKRTTKIRVTGFFILGHPKETIEDVEATIEFSRKVKLDRANYFNFSPFPGNADYEELRKAGNDYNKYYDSLYINNVIYTSPNISRRQLMALQRKAFRRFFLRRDILLNIFREIHSWSQFKVFLVKILRLLREPEKL